MEASSPIRVASLNASYLDNLPLEVEQLKGQIATVVKSVGTSNHEHRAEVGALRKYFEKEFQKLSRHLAAEASRKGTAR